MVWFCMYDNTNIPPYQLQSGVKDEIIHILFCEIHRRSWKKIVSSNIFQPINQLQISHFFHILAKIYFLCLFQIFIIEVHTYSYECITGQLYHKMYEFHISFISYLCSEIYIFYVSYDYTSMCVSLFSTRYIFSTSNFFLKLLHPVYLTKDIHDHLVF